jgi:hypothetical protein
LVFLGILSVLLREWISYWFFKEKYDINTEKKALKRLTSQLQNKDGQKESSTTISMEIFYQKGKTLNKERFLVSNKVSIIYLHINLSIIKIIWYTKYKALI